MNLQRMAADTAETVVGVVRLLVRQTLDTARMLTPDVETDGCWRAQCGRAAWVRLDRRQARRGCPHRHAASSRRRVATLESPVRPGQASGAGSCGQPFGNRR